MTGWGLGFVVLALLAGAGPELDCARPAAARSLVGRMMLSEIEGAEDIHRAAMWDAFGRCPAGPGRERCVAGEKRRFEADWQRQKAGIEAKYQRILEDFDERCRATLT